MRGTLRSDRHKAALVAGFVIAGALMTAAPAVALTRIRLAWSANTEPDLAGYRLYHGTQSGAYGPPISLGKVTAYEIDNLDPAKFHYFVLTAVDEAGNESQPSAEVGASATVVRDAPPTIDSALEVVTGSIYLAQGGVSAVRVTGSDFQPGATADFGAGTVAGSTTFYGAAELRVSVEIIATAQPGLRDVTITNPDGSVGHLPDALQVVKSADLNRNCVIDATDLNLLARAWNRTSAEPGFQAVADLDGDNFVGPDDLTIFAKFFGQVRSPCP